MTSLVWLRDDLRIADNPALHAAVARGEPVVVLFVLDEQSPGIRPLGSAARWWLHGSLTALAATLAARGGTLVLRRGPAAIVVPDVVHEAGASAVFWNRRYGGPEREVDAGIKARLRADGLEAMSFAASLLHEPWTVRTGAGTPYAVFTPFWNACLAAPPPRRPLPEPAEMPAPPPEVGSDDLDAWDLLPQRPDWAAGLRKRWSPGEPAAHDRLRTFLDEDSAGYDRARDEPAAEATSLLSPRLRWGELSPHQVWHAAIAAGAPATFLRELGWREFAWHTLFHAPDLATRNLRPEFDRFPWPEPSAAARDAWQRGSTGIALVDAGMRELWHTGFMHNRVRMVAASFLVKNLLVHWRHGETWFWDTLVDADPAANPFNWQWVAGSGADAAPYFRVFNPDLQRTKFDPDGAYVARWAAAPASLPPIVDLRATRQAALAAYDSMRRGMPGAAGRLQSA
ncbi:cryptochrome/photolyase family protein [Microbacterium sp.]|uniref:cryptochrome/photolyase family protein n=1 Tax=Microbacterium sp. TaxID=51671 RepID=UPI003A8869A0